MISGIFRCLVSSLIIAPISILPMLGAYNLMSVFISTGKKERHYSPPVKFVTPLYPG